MWDYFQRVAEVGGNERSKPVRLHTIRPTTDPARTVLRTVHAGNTLQQDMRITDFGFRIMLNPFLCQSV